MAFTQAGLDHKASKPGQGCQVTEWPGGHTGAGSDVRWQEVNRCFCCFMELRTRPPVDRLDLERGRGRGGGQRPGGAEARSRAMSRVFSCSDGLTRTVFPFQISLSFFFFFFFYR